MEVRGGVGAVLGLPTPTPACPQPRVCKETQRRGRERRAFLGTAPGPLPPSPPEQEAAGSS